MYVALSCPIRTRLSGWHDAVRVANAPRDAISATRNVVRPVATSKSPAGEPHTWS